MQPQTELLFRLRDWIDEKLPETKAALEELSDDGRIYLEIGPGADERRYLRGTVQNTVPVLFMAKRPGGREAECLELLSGLCAMALAMGRPPEGTSYEAAGLEISSAPGKAARYEDGTVLYSCIINFKIIY